MLGRRRERRNGIEGFSGGAGKNGSGRAGSGGQLGDRLPCCSAGGVSGGALGGGIDNAGCGRCSDGLVGRGRGHFSGFFRKSLAAFVFSALDRDGGLLARRPSRGSPLGQAMPRSEMTGGVGKSTRGCAAGTGARLRWRGGGGGGGVMDGVDAALKDAAVGGALERGERTMEEEQVMVRSSRAPSCLRNALSCWLRAGRCAALGIGLRTRAGAGRAVRHRRCSAAAGWRALSRCTETCRRVTVPLVSWSCMRTVLDTRAIRAPRHTRTQPSPVPPKPQRNLKYRGMTSPPQLRALPTTLNRRPAIGPSPSEGAIPAVGIRPRATRIRWRLPDNTARWRRH